MEITRAKPGDAGALSAVAQAAKAYWNYPPHWLERWREQLTIHPDFIAAHDTFSILHQGRIVGFYALLEGDDNWRLEHLWILPEWIGQGLGRRLFTHAAARAAGRGASSLTIQADPNAAAFYLHLGARRIGASRSEIEGQLRELPLLVFEL